MSAPNAQALPDSGGRRGRPRFGLVLGIVGLITWIVPVIGFPVSITGLIFSINSLSRREKGIPVAGVLTCAIGILLSIASAWIGFNRAVSFDQANAPAQIAEKVAAPPESISGLTKSELLLSATTVTGHWVESDLLANDSASWSGSAGVVGILDDKLLLVTNAHCLGLSELFTADADGSPEIEAYELVVEFSTGKRAPVHRVGIQADEIDVAFLVVSSVGLQENVDYITLPSNSDLVIEPGAAVVAVGSPLGLHGTQTFGRVSAIREVTADQTSYRFIQVDAAINHGNSGGPLFLSLGDHFIFIGINTMKMEGAEGLGFAIDRAILESDRFHWINVDEIRDGSAFTK